MVGSASCATCVANPLPTRPAEEELQGLLREAREAFASALAADGDDDADHGVFVAAEQATEALSTAIADAMVSSVRPLADVFHRLGPEAYLAVCGRLIDARIHGPMVAWAYEFSREDPQQFARDLDAKSDEIVEHVNAKAAVWASFAGNRALAPAGAGAGGGGGGGGGGEN